MAFVMEGDCALSFNVVKASKNSCFLCILMLFCMLWLVFCKFVEQNKRFILRMDPGVCHGLLLLMNHEHQVATVTVNGIKVNVLL